MDEQAAAAYRAAFYTKIKASTSSGNAPECFERPGERGSYAYASEALRQRVKNAGGTLRSEQYAVIETRAGARRVVSKEGTYDGDTYLSLVAKGLAQLSEFDAYVSRWNVGEGGDAPLHAYLGLSAEEYAQILKEKSTLSMLALARAVQSLAPKVHAHLKSSGQYLVLGTGKQERDGQAVTVYLGVDGTIWVRDAEEFADGRFALQPSQGALKLSLASR